jgi:hypothetical protein
VFLTNLTQRLFQGEFKLSPTLQLMMCELMERVTSGAAAIVLAESDNYLDCFRDDAARVLVSASKRVSSAMTVPMCIAHCREKVSVVAYCVEMMMSCGDDVK